LSDATCEANETLELELARRLDPVCDRFGGAWLARPRLEDFLGDVAEPDRPALSEALWHLYYNGARPVVESQALSVEDIRAGAVGPGVQALVVRHTERAMRALIVQGTQ